MPVFQDLPIIDSHQHLTSHEGIEPLMYKNRKFGYRAVGIATLCLDEEGAARNAAGMLMKALYPSQVYLWGGLQYRLAGPDPRHVNLVAQARSLMATGCDGIKMLEGKPNIRRHLGVELDEANLMDFYEFMQAHNKPVLCHVGDPEEFWDADRCPQWAKNSGWFYDSSYVTLEELRKETDDFLRRFPRLKVTFPHFYFLAGDLATARRFMEDHPAVCLDLTPGREQYPKFARDVDGWRKFFIEFQDRIIYGTDVFDTDTANDRPRMELVRQFLETDGPFNCMDMACHGLGLPAAVLDRIYSGNFVRVASAVPAELNLELCVAHCDHVAERAVRIGEDRLRQKVLAELASVAHRLHEMRVVHKQK